MKKELLNQVNSYISSILAPNSAESFSQQFTSGAFWSLVGSIVSRGMGLVAGILAARLLGVAAFGEFGLIRTTVLTAGVLTGYGVGLTLTKYTAQLKEEDPKKIGRIISLIFFSTVIISIITFIVFYIISPRVSEIINLNINNINQLRIAGLIIVANAIWTALQALLVGFEQYKEIAINNFIYGIVVVVSVVLLTILFGITGTIIAYILSTTITAFFAGRIVLQSLSIYGIQLTTKFSMDDFSVLKNFSAPAYISGILVLPITLWAFSKISSTPLGNEEIGLFNMAEQWRTLILFIPQSIGLMILPMLSKAYGKVDFSEYRKVFFSNLVINLSVGCLLVISIILFQDIILSVYGEEYQRGGKVIILLSITAVIQIINMATGQVIASSGKMWWGVVVNLIWALCMVISILYIFQLTSLGLANALLFSYSIMLISSGIFLILHFRYSDNQPLI